MEIYRASPQFAPARALSSRKPLKARQRDQQMFSYTSPNLTWAQLRHLSSRATLSVEIIAAAAVVLLASASTLANVAENPARLAREKHACAVVLGLDPSGRRYSVCVSSLDKSLSELDQARLATRLPPVRQLSQSVW
jgi:hypothetical protein